ncbi:Ykud domain-containing protein [Schinkia azotoformans MEV2011]|uniref:Ykud domain-containing protein n=1 Tax=Schinkia azotoformans MEV2011 TaxID=1348973 RepID=A0A072NQV1_SCHAZ|nr:L,D-transpeptidase [Schinkia azotoformans]KEF39283.1 Ykud domain-containing protein [Schinkia azotoformans MEV2011]
MVKKGLYSLIIFSLITVMFMPLKTIQAAEVETSSYLIINKAVNELAYFKDGELVRVFDVGTGKSRKLTPEGTFKIINKVKTALIIKKRFLVVHRKIHLGTAGWAWMYLEHGDIRMGSMAITTKGQ